MDTSQDRRVDAVLRDARRQIDATDAEWLLAHALGRTRTWLYAHAGDGIDPAAGERFAALLARRAAGEPVAYLLGRRGFWTFDLMVTPDTLIPRPETERLVELALDRLPTDRELRVADLGTGSGAIALALARERPRARVVATDASAAALAIARRNAEALAVANVDFRRGDWCEALDEGTFDLIASNPPYIADHDPHLHAGDLRFEPATALQSGSDGLDALRAIASTAAAHLLPGGWLLLEHGLEQGEAVRALLQSGGMIDIATERDLEARDRITLGRLPPDPPSPPGLHPGRR